MNQIEMDTIRRSNATAQQRSWAALCIALLFSPVASAQQPTPAATVSSGPVADRPASSTWTGGNASRYDGRFSWLLKPYKATTVPPVSLGNSDRIEQLMRAGNLYLSLNDAIALALENNIDIETQRYGTPIAEANILRAQAGGALRGVTPTVVSGPTSATALTTGSGTTGSSSTGSSSGFTTSGVQGNASTQAAQSTSSSQGALIQQTGTAIPSLDPYISGILRYSHSTTPQSNVVVTGTTAYISDQDIGTFSYNQSFLTGTTFSLGVSDVNASVNSYSTLINPSKTASLTFSFQQHLLQGFGVSVNNREIVIARNNREAADLSFKLQVITTVVAVQDLYWDLVYFLDDVKAKQQALAYNQRLYSDNKKQVEVGTMAPIEIVQAEAAVASAEQDLTISQTRVLQQETTLKSYLSRTGVASPALAAAHVIPTDRIRVPEQEQVQPIQDLTALALSSRPELAQQRISVTNAGINMKGSHAELLPTLDLVAGLNNNGLVGVPNTVPVPPSTQSGGVVVPRGTPDPFFVGGYGQLLTQLFDRNFPDYYVGVQLNIPLRNRTARADYLLDQITYRQQQLQLQSQENQVRLDVQNAIIGVQQAHVTYDAAVKARILEQQTLDAEQQKLRLGTSTVFNVIQIQRDLANSLSAEVSALDAYAKAKVELERSTGQVLTNHNISLREAFRGHVSAPPSALPPLGQ